jgi:hypothetical protein
MISRFTKKPITIEAFEFVDATLETMSSISEFMGEKKEIEFDGTSAEPKIKIETLEGPIYASIGDMIIKGIHGEFYPCKPDIFHKSYNEEGKEDKGEISDGYHTFNELYDFRKMYNATAFNAWAKEGLYDVHKSKCHSDGLPCFNGGWFIVMAVLPGGQVSNHYELKDWDLFQCPEEPFVKHHYDGHTAQDVLNRLEEVCLTPNK